MLDFAASRVVYTGSGSTDTFPVQDEDGNAIYFETNSHIHVAKYTIATDTLDDLDEGVDYTLTGGPATGQVVLSAGNLAAGYKLVIWRSQPLDQTADFGISGSFSSATHSLVADRHRRIDQDLADDLYRALKTDRADAAFDAGSRRIKSLADPVADGDAVPKGYGDDHWGGAAAASAVAAAAEAAASAVAAASAWDDFDDRYLGSKASDPLVDNDGDAIETGALYWNSTVSEMRVYRSGAWVGWGEAYAIGSVSTRAALAALDPAVVSAAYLTQSYCSGLFRRVAYADYSTLVNADTNKIVSVRSTVNTAYAWLRDGADPTCSFLMMDWARDTADTGVAAAFARCVTLGTAMLRCGALALPGLRLYWPAGECVWESTTSVLASNLHNFGHPEGTYVKGASNLAVAPMLRRLGDSAQVGVYVNENITLDGITFDGSLRPFKQYLTKADGTPITDPEADWVVGSGALGLGITGLSLTPVMAAVAGGNEVSAVTVVSGGANFKGHATLPYLPNTVPLWFSGGGTIHRIASGYATISGGSIVSTTITDPGLYSGTPTVSVAGGYADPSLLLDPSVDRRNGLAYDQVNDKLVQIVQTRGVTIRNCRFIYHKWTLDLFGCSDSIVENNYFEDCGTTEAIAPIIYNSDYFIGATTITMANGNVIRNNRSRIRSKQWPGIFVYNSASGSTLIEGNSHEASAFIQLGVTPKFGHVCIIRNNRARNLVFTAYASHFGEAVGGANIIVENNVIDGSQGPGFGGLYGIKNARFRNNTQRNIWQTAGGIRNSFLPQAERTKESVGLMPYVFMIGDGSSGRTRYANLIASGNTTPQTDCVYENETIIDDRTAAQQPPCFLMMTRFSAGSLNAMKNIEIKGVRRLKTDGTPNPDIPLLHNASTADDVLEAAYSLRLVGNPDHASEAPVIVSQTFASGSNIAYTIAAGFPPKRVVVEAYDPADAARMFRAEWVWRGAEANGWASRGRWVTLGSPGVSGVVSDKCLQLRNSSGVVVFEATFTRWNVTGFVVTVTTSTAGCQAEFICEP